MRQGSDYNRTMDFKLGKEGRRGGTVKQCSMAVSPCGVQQVMAMGGELEK